MIFLCAPPSAFSPIYIILKKLVQVLEKIGQSHILVTADMAIYTKGQQMIWSKTPALGSQCYYGAWWNAHHNGIPGIHRKHVMEGFWDFYLILVFMEKPQHNQCYQERKFLKDSI